MNKEDNFGRLLMLLLITLCICLGLYYLPDNMFGQKIKKVDLLSDLRGENAIVVNGLAA